MAVIAREKKHFGEDNQNWLGLVIGGRWLERLRLLVAWAELVEPG